jgi:tellurite methyltransferase
MTDWGTYHRNSADLPPRPWLVSALAEFGSVGHAIDIGCGSGRDTLYLLEMGWSVEALDSNRAALDLLVERTPRHLRSRLVCTAVSMEDADLHRASLVNAAFSLPFCQPQRGPALWNKIAQAIEPSGMFVGQFFGPGDEWASSGLWTVSRSELEQMLSGWTVLQIAEFEGLKTTSVGQSKQSHIFDVIAKSNH